MVTIRPHKETANETTRIRPICIFVIVALLSTLPTTAAGAQDSTSPRHEAPGTGLVDLEGAEVQVSPRGSPTLNYVDVGYNHFAALDIAALAVDGILAGTDCQAGRFCPEMAIQRWQIAVWIVRVLDGGEPAPRASRFADIEGRPWWESHVERLAELGVTRGCSAQPARFCPTSTVTRAQMAAFIDRAFNLEDAGDAGFSDTSGVFSKNAIDRVFRAGITRGCAAAPLRFCPDLVLSRAQMAALLHRARPVSALSDAGSESAPSIRVDALPNIQFSANPPDTGRVIVPVYICAAPNEHSSQDVAREVDSLNIELSTFFRRNSGDRSDLRFTPGGVISPDVVWSGESIHKWANSDNYLSPCYTHLTSRGGLSGPFMILADVSICGTARSCTNGYGPPDGYRGLESHVVVPTRERYESKGWNSEYATLVAHEIGHAVYELCHTFDSSSICSNQGSDEDVQNCTPTNRCNGDENLWHLAQSLMSYDQYGSRSKLSDSYIACEQRQWLQWTDICEPAVAVPGPVTGLTANGTVITWSPPSDDGGSPITGYAVGYSDSLYGGWIPPANIGTSTSYTLPGHLSGTVTVTVTAYNSAGASLDATTTTTMPAAVPGPVTGLTLNGTVVTWSPPSDDGGSPITGYAVGYSDSTTYGDRIYIGTSTSYPLPGHLSGTVTVTVTAYNSAGAGPDATMTLLIDPPLRRPMLTVWRGGPGVSGSCTAASGCEWVHGRGSGWTPGAQFWIKCGDSVDTSQNKPVPYLNRYVDSNGDLSWGDRICLSNFEHTVEVWTNHDNPVRVTVPAPDPTQEPTLTVWRGGPGVSGSCTAASGCEWVHGRGSGWTPGAQFWIKCGDSVDTSQNKPVPYLNRYVDSNGNLSWGDRICLSNFEHTVEVWTNHDNPIRVTVPAP